MKQDMTETWRIGREKWQKDGIKESAMEYEFKRIEYTYKQTSMHVKMLATATATAYRY